MRVRDRSYTEDDTRMADNNSTVGEAMESSDTIDVAFHGISYIATVSTVNSDTLCIEIEQRNDASRWRGDFTSRYIEDITAKTGNFKKFPVFVRMLVSALKQSSDSVFADLLTYQDLEVLKARKAGHTGQSSKSLIPNNKRYLILTYAAEFDRVHYPLPLLYEENPDPQRLKSVISALRAELDALHSQQEGASGVRKGSTSEHAAEVRRLRDENAALKQELKAAERMMRGDGADSSTTLRELKKARKDVEQLQARTESLEAELERERGVHRREMRKKAKENQEVYDELSRQRDVVRDLRHQIRQLQQELDARPARSSTDRIRAAYGTTSSGSGRYGRDAPPARPYSSGAPRSRGASPSSSSRGPGYSSIPKPTDYTRPRDTSSRERSRNPSPSTSRPSSAPAGRSGSRFDPTEYVRQRRVAMERRGSASSSRAPTPPRSAASSGRTSPVPIRPSGSVDRGRGMSPVGSRPTSSDGGGVARSRLVPPLDRPHRQVVELVSTRSRDSSPRLPHGTGWSTLPVVAARPGSGSRPPSAERSTSPGRALQEVKKKLSDFVTKRSSTDGLESSRSQGSLTAHTIGSTQASLPMSSTAGTAALPGTAASSQAARAAAFNDTSAEIADIDSRLHALQNFLRMAKASAASSSGAGAT